MSYEDYVKKIAIHYGVSDEKTLRIIIRKCRVRRGLKLRKVLGHNYVISMISNVLERERSRKAKSNFIKRFYRKIILRVKGKFYV